MYSFHSTHCRGTKPLLEFKYKQVIGKRKTKKHLISVPQYRI